LETTLKIWAALSGTSSRSRIVDAIESYLRQIIPAIESTLFFRNLALQMVIKMQPAISHKEAGHLMKTNVNTIDNKETNIPDENHLQVSSKPSKRGRLSGSTHLFPGTCRIWFIIT